jgi:hypothetical protein
MTYQWVNYLLAISNLIGVPAFLASQTPADRLMVGTIMLGSTLMHLSERKHQLPGVKYLDPYHGALLNFDRLMSLVGGLYFIPRVWRDPWSLVIGAIGITALRVGEYLTTPSPFVYLHLVWHAAVYMVLFRAVRI